MFGVSMTMELEPQLMARNGGTALGRLIGQLRESRDMSKQALADRVGVSRGYISQLEAGADKTPSRDVIFNLAEAFGVGPGELLLAAGYLSDADAREEERRMLAEIDTQSRLSAANKETIKNLYLGLVRGR